MREIMHLVFTIFFSLIAFVQNVLKTIIQGKNANDPLYSASVLLKNIQNGGASDDKGFAGYNTI
jgi:hypothetical protein